MRKAIDALAMLAFVSGVLPGQAPFPEGADGEIYYAPRIDLLAPEDGGPLAVALDGSLEEEAWARAAWHGWSYAFEGARGGGGLDPGDDCDVEWAALADREFLYVAWRVRDEEICSGEEPRSCDVWKDDSFEIYIDALNDGPDCTADASAACYGADDAQITVGADNIDRDDPDELVIGGVGPSLICDYSGAHPEVARGIVREWREDGEVVGWQAEIAIPLETAGNDDDGTPTWTISPDHGRMIGFNIHVNDDDAFGGRDHKLIWSLRESTDSSFRNPGVFGKLMFIDPNRGYLPVADLVCVREADGSVSLAWTNPVCADARIQTRILVDGAEVARVGGLETRAALPEAVVPRDGRDHRIEVVNNSDFPASCTIVQSAFDGCGAIRRWNLLGAFLSPKRAIPSLDEIRSDWLTDGRTTEKEFVFRPGARISTDFGGAAWSAGIEGGPAGRNPGGVPTVFPRYGESGLIDFQGPEGFAGNVDYAMVYAQAYVIAEKELSVTIGIATSDSVQVFLEGEEVFIRRGSRAGPDPCAPMDLTSQPVALKRGANRLLVKSFEGAGSTWLLAVRFQDAEGRPVTEGLDIRDAPESTGPSFRRGDANGDGKYDIGDAIRVLNHLFADGPMDCRDAADVSDDGKLDIGDPIRLLNYLFANGPAPEPPGISCGPDPTEDPLDCASYPSCP